MQKYGLSLSLVPLTNHFLAAMVRATQQSVVCVIYSRYGNGEQARREGRREGRRRSAHVQKLKERAPSARSLVSEPLEWKEGGMALCSIINVALSHAGMAA